MTHHHTSAIELWINRLFQRFVPVWYASKIVHQLSMPNYGVLNPADCNSNHWFNLQQVIPYVIEQLKNSEPRLQDKAKQDWQKLIKELSHLLVYKTVQRNISISRLTGCPKVEPNSGQFDSLAEWIMAESDPLDFEDDEAFNIALKALNHHENGFTPLTYREWDGRINLSSDSYLSDIKPIMRYALEHQHKAEIRASLTLEYIHEPSLERIRDHYWWFLMHKSSATQLSALMDNCRFPVMPINDLPGRSNMAFLFANKQDRNINRVILNMISKRNSRELTEFGRYLSNHRHRFRNQ